MRISRRHLLLGSVVRALAQDASFSADVNVVTLLATVRDRDGQMVKDLNREDFLLLEDGKPQTISYFTRETDLPLTIGLLVDTSRSQSEVLEPERRASLAFLDRVLREDKDKAFVAHFDTKVEVLQDFTSSRKLLSEALDRLTIPGEFATLIYESVRQCSESLMRKETGRKAFIMLSDGVSFRDKTSLGTAIEYTQRADTMIYSILFADRVKPYRPIRAATAALRDEHGKSVMKRLARETGGAYFEVSAANSIEKIYSAIEDALRNQYSIGYTPTEAGRQGQYHKITLATKHPSGVVQARDGYYSR